MTKQVRPDDIDFASLVHEGDTVVCAQALSEPVCLLRRLVAQRRDIGPFNLFIGPSLSGVLRPEHGDTITFRSYCGTAGNASLQAGGAFDLVPGHYSELPRLFAQGAIRADVVLLSLSEPDQAGQYHLGTSVDYVVDAARRARVVIAEVGDRVPWINGAELPADVQPHIVVRTGREPLTVERSAANGGVEDAIARRVSELVPDGATLELGLGLLPDKVLQALGAHKDLGVHTGVIGDAIVDLMQSGAINNTRKPFDQGISVAAMLLGSRRLLDFAHCNPQVQLKHPSRTHDHAVIRSIPHFVAINCALEVDLTGQVNSESLNGRYVGAIGGQVDFVRGANLSRGGCSIMVLPSTDRKGLESRVVAKLPDDVVTTARSDVDIVVTEHGVARLRGKSIAERARAIAAIAHPGFRESLERRAHGFLKQRGGST